MKLLKKKVNCRGDKMLEVSEQKTKSKIDVNKLSIREQKDYYEDLRAQCLLLKNNQLHFGQNAIKTIYPFLRSYQIEIQGEENVPRDSNVLFVANHSNSHDIFTAYELFSKLERKGSVMVATDCLNPLTTQIFKASDATLLDRRVKKDRGNSILQLSNKLLSGKDGLIFGEGTWNLHPTLPMHNIQNGAAKVSIITQIPIVPVIIEYIEKNEFVKSDGALYAKCVIRFGKPIMIDANNTLPMQSQIIKMAMSDIRETIWKDYNIQRESIENIDPRMYINHTYAKKFKAFGFTYDSKMEQNYLLFLGNVLRENEYTLNSKGEFVPGITEKSSELRKILR